MLNVASIKLALTTVKLATVIFGEATTVTAVAPVRFFPTRFTVMIWLRVAVFGVIEFNAGLSCPAAWNSIAPTSMAVPMSGLGFPKKSVGGASSPPREKVGMWSIAGDPAASAKLPSCAPVTGLVNASGPHRMLTQLLPSSTVADGARLKTSGLLPPTEPINSLVPGGTCQPMTPFSGGVREPLQYWVAMGLVAGARLFEPP